MLACPECERPLAVGRCDCRRDWTETGGVPDIYVAAPERGEDPALTARIHQFYEDRPAEDVRPEADPVLVALDAILADTARVVDLGCGTGAAAAWLGRDGRSVLGVDLAMSALLRAESNRRRDGLEGLSFVRGNLLRPPVRAAGADVVLCLGSLETCGAPEGGVAAAAALLRPGGLLLARVATPWGPETPPDKAPPHDGRYPPDVVREWFDAAGLRPLDRQDTPVLQAVLTPPGGGLRGALRSARWSWLGGGPAVAVIAGRRQG